VIGQLEAPGPGRWDRAYAVARRRLHPYWAAVVTLLAVLALAASELSPEVSAFWQRHQIVTSLFTGTILTLLVVLGLDRLLEARARRRWRPVGTMISREFVNATTLEEFIHCCLLEYCEEAYGLERLPEDREYREILLEVLQDRAIWETRDGVAGLLESVSDEERALKEAFATWAPVLIAEPALADIGSSATRVLTAVIYVSVGLSAGFSDDRGGRTASWMPEPYAWRMVCSGLDAYRQAVGQLEAKVASYDTG
jgi:hypothetical protein